VQHHFGHRQLGVERRARDSAEVQRHAVGERLIPGRRHHRHMRAAEALTDLSQPPDLLRVAIGELVHDNRRLVHEPVQVFHFLLGQRLFAIALVVPVTAEHLADRPEPELRCLRHEDVLVAVQKRSHLELGEQPRPAVVDDDVRHALEKLQHGQVLPLAEIGPGTLIRSIAADHSHALQPCDCITQIGVDLDAVLHAGLMKAADRKRPPVPRQSLDRRAPQPAVPVRHVVIGVGEYHPVGGPRGGVDGR
jgi:hypothetical protein